MKADGLFDDSLFVVSADHGESFGRGFIMHGGPYLYQELIHVPLLIKFPNQTILQRVHQTVSHVDIASTILNILGQFTPQWMDGQSFLSTIMAGEDTGPKLSMNFSLINN